MAKDGQQAKVTQGAVRKPRGGNDVLAFLKEHLDRSAFDLYVEIVDAVIQRAQCVEQLLLDRRVAAQAVEY
ncbi:hypothetical protein D3C87_1249460 [compost metagenome]